MSGMWTLLLATAIAQGGPTQVTSTDALVVPGPNGTTMAEVVVANNTGKIAVAWRLRVESTLSTGQVESQTLTADNYASPDTSELAIRQFGSARAHVPIAGVKTGVTVERVRAVVECAVFEDRTWTGDDTAVQNIFRRREQEARVFAFIATALRAGYAAGDADSNRMRIALELLNATDQEDFDHPHKLVLRRTLQNAIEGRGSAPTPVTLEGLIKDAEAKWTIANQQRLAAAPVPSK